VRSLVALPSPGPPRGAHAGLSFPGRDPLEHRAGLTRAAGPPQRMCGSRSAARGATSRQLVYDAERVILAWRSCCLGDGDHLLGIVDGSVSALAIESALM
jgi:hypothetical protein